MGYGYGGFGGGFCGYGNTAPVAAPVGVNPFVLIVVLFILLIIVGAAWC
ncbi:YjcZ family sporulation protein [Metabacillus litoralis]|nr:YjcZ family sporulation protein [Metabacillus litoralis]